MDHEQWQEPGDDWSPPRGSLEFRKHWYSDYLTRLVIAVGIAVLLRCSGLVPLWPALLAILWFGLIQPVGSAAIGLYRTQQKSDGKERRQTVSPDGN